MEAILESQTKLQEGMKQLLTNFKKDGPDRKTYENISRRIETLEQYWAEFKKNHDKISHYLNADHEYFVGNYFEDTKNFYNETREIFRKAIAEKSPAPPPTKSRMDIDPINLPSTPSLPEYKTPTTFTSHGTNSKLDDMIKKQNSNFKAFTRTTSYIQVESIKEKWELEDTLRSLQSRWQAIDDLHWDIDSELNGADSTYEKAYSDLEQQYQHYKKVINIKIWSISHREKSTPQTDMPIFTGNYQQWVSFKDLFIDTIHKNPSLSNAQKMQYLKGKIRGEAERLIQHLQISSENYETSWEILNHRYNNKKLIFTSHINSLLNIPVIQQVSCNNLKRVHDLTKECLYAIKNLGINIDSWDPLLVHLLCQKLDAETHYDYTTSLKEPRELPKISDFLTFLESKFITLESSSKKNELTSSSLKGKSLKISSQFEPKKLQNHKQSHAQSQVFNKPIHNHSKCEICNEGFHKIFHCKRFMEMSAYERQKTVVQLKLCRNCLYNHNGKECISKSKCRECNADHNTLLHFAYSATIRNNAKYPASPRNKSVIPSQGENCDHVSHVSQSRDDLGEILLATAMVQVKGSDGSYHTFRALIDQGSQLSIITEAAAQILGWPRKRNRGVISGVGAKENTCKGAINISCKARHSNYTFDTEVVIMKTLIKDLPNYTFQKPTWEFLNNIQLADPDFNIKRPVDLLLGANIYSLIILEGIIRDEPTLPIAQHTRLGWILCGNYKTYHCNVVLDTDDLQKFWEIEDIHEQSEMSHEDQQCVDFYLSTTKRLDNGRYEVRLPLTPDHEEKLGLSRPLASAQFHNLERRFDKNKQFASDYKSFMTRYQELGHMIQSSKSGSPECVIPHHAIEREEAVTSKFRVVFNFSARTSTNFSLNDVMYKGPNLQQDLQHLIIKWRQYQYAYTSDIEMMYRNIHINTQDQKYQKVLWRSSVEQPIQSYQLTTVTYGAKAAPFLAMMTLKRLATEGACSYPEAAKAVGESFYMDDYCGGSHSVEGAIKLRDDLIKLLHSGGFNLRKWAANEPELLSGLRSDQCNPQTYQFRQVDTTKTLGLGWNPQRDVFVFKSKIAISEKTPTKRSILSDISKLFDPLGWLAPITTSMKILFQSVWLSNLQWDDHLPEEIRNKWIKFREELEEINSFEIKRWLGTSGNDCIELHGFCDASRKAYASVIYCKCVRQGEIQVSLVAAKTRLVPVTKNNISTPRLEISGALLLSKLMEKVQQSYSDHKIKIYGWTDSTAVLGWLQGDPGRWKQFIANRVKTITNIIPANCWRYVNTNENPADCASRGLTVLQLKQHLLWWEGPSWLSSLKQDLQAIPAYTTDLETKNIKQINTITKQSNQIEDIVIHLLNNYSSFNKLVRIFTWILRIASKQKDRHSYLTLREIAQAKYKIIKVIQQAEFLHEITCLKADKTLPTDSKLKNLNAFMDEMDILRVGGRLRNAYIPSETKHPIIIPHDSQLTTLLIDQAHELTFHGGARVTLSNLRQKYWILGGNRAVKKRLSKCVTCRKNNPLKQKQLMGDLPEARVNPAPAFSNAGVDYTGFVSIKTNKGRGVATTKGYIVIFVCLVTKATHLEIVSDCSSAAFLSALRRMAARRGAPLHLYSDNGTNFIGASKTLQKEYIELKEVLDDHFFKEITDMNIEWHFNAPSWPSAGGLWERTVRSLKHHVKRVVGEQKLTFEEWSTLLAQIEACLNSRPLCALSEDPEDLDFLTPAHFLTGRAGLTVIETDQDARTRWHMVSKINQNIWKRWQAEYLTQLSSRSKWLDKQRNMVVGDLVIIHEENIPPGRWAMGRVTELHPGKDGLVRVVTLKTKNGHIKRPIVKLSILQESEQKTENKEEERSRTSRKHSTPKINFMSLCTVFLLFMTLLSRIECSVNITKLRENQGLYFDKISNMQLIKDEWKLVVFYEMKPYWQGIKALANYTNTLEKTCISIQQEHRCNTILLQLRYGITELEYYNQLLSGHSNPEGRRTRRGLINVVGYLASELFGVLDERFADQYNKDIELIKQNQKHIVNLWKNQTSVIEAENNALKRIEKSLSEQYSTLKQHMATLDQAVQKSINIAQTNMIVTDISIEATVASNMLNSLKGLQNTLLDTITDIYQGRFSTHLLTPSQLIDELSTISSQVPKEVSLPIVNIHADLRKIYQLLRIKTRAVEDYLLFEIRVPLVSRDSFEIFKIIPIPKLQNGKFIHVVPISNYISINIKKDTYITMTENDVTACLRQSDTYFCHSHKPEYHMIEYSKLCLQENNQCKVIEESCSNTWLESYSLNMYIYLCCKQCLVRAICENQMSAHQLTGAGIVTIEHGCLLKTDKVTIYPFKLHSSESNIAPSLYPLISPINDMMNITIPMLYINMSNQDDQLQDDISSRIQNLKQAEENILEEADRLSDHDVHHYVMIYVVIGLIVSISTCFMIQRIRNKWKLPSESQSSENSRPTPSSRRSTRAGDTGEAIPMERRNVGSSPIYAAINANRF